MANTRYISSSKTGIPKDKLSVTHI